tara:strand:+ start:15028 stop:15354 length:327 start_codon:yes stop_codon:yes gene_type:complete
VIKLKDLLSEQSVEVGSAYDNNGEIELVIDKHFVKGKWKVVDFDLKQDFYKGGGTSSENILKKQKKVKLKPSQINKIKKIIKNPEDKHYLEKDNFRVNDVIAALKRNK